jgi:hypothetical protein
VLGEFVPDLADTLQPGLTDEQVDTLSAPHFVRSIFPWTFGCCTAGTTGSLPTAPARTDPSSPTPTSSR